MDAGVELADGADRISEVRVLFAEGAEDLAEDLVGLRRLLAAVLLLPRAAVARGEKRARAQERPVLALLCALRECIPRSRAAVVCALRE